ncbi:MAG: 3-deoxy-manno-octulosonate cytidylyltransferase [Alphaproteobacteria bacterium]|nr:3-deoxy-manno-octulosonate cytidylyltransferase [Alphaproteobacteria bacterium]
MIKNTLVVIPTRLGATRLPNKPLADICGKPMIVRVWEKAIRADVGPVIVASAEQEIVDIIESLGGHGVLTHSSLATGTDRVKAAVDMYDPQGKYSHVINIQGDLPTLEPDLVRHVLEPFEDPTVDMATLATPITDPHELTDGNVVKIALSLRDGKDIGRALYFSRNLMPSGDGPHFHHIGLYAYTRDCLNRFVDLPVNDLEVRERLEQLRALAHGIRIEVKLVETQAPFGVDTPADLAKAIRVIRALEARSV